MNNEDILLLAQLLQTMKDLIEKLDDDYNNKDVKSFNEVKKEILRIQKKIKEVI